jgi:hypothetical protein
LLGPKKAKIIGAQLHKALILLDGLAQVQIKGNLKSKFGWKTIETPISNINSGYKT